MGKQEKLILKWKEQILNNQLKKIDVWVFIYTNCL